MKIMIKLEQQFPIYDVNSTLDPLFIKQHLPFVFGLYISICFLNISWSICYYCLLDHQLEQPKIK